MLTEYNETSNQTTKCPGWAEVCGLQVLLVLVCNLVDTSRPISDGELDGREYHFVSKDVFEAAIAEGRFVEFGEYEKQLFGTSMDAIRQVVNSGKVCILNFHPQVCTAILYVLQIAKYEQCSLRAFARM